MLENNDVVFGVRSPRKDPILRVLMSYFLGVLSKIILESNLKDINCGFRGFKHEASKKIKINFNYNFVGPEVYMLSKLNNLKICEMKIKHYKRISGTSCFNGFLKSDVEWIIYRSKQVPGPSHYRPKLVEPNKGVRFSDANPKSDVDWIIHRSKKTPGPGQYPLKSTLAGGGVKFSDANPKSDLEWTIYNASQVPGPARYNIELCP